MTSNQQQCVKRLKELTGEEIISANVLASILIVIDEALEQHISKKELQEWCEKRTDPYTIHSDKDLLGKGKYQFREGQQAMLKEIQKLCK